MCTQLSHSDKFSLRRVAWLATRPLGLLLLIAAVATSCDAARAPGDTRPNLVFFFPDTIAAEAMGSYYKNPIVRAPNFEKLARSGTVFTAAYSSYPQCSPSRAALITGVSIRIYFMRENCRLRVRWLFACAGVSFF
jgi:hypothetical protein